MGYLTNAQQGQPDWLQPWFSLWLAVVTPASSVFIGVTRNPRNRDRPRPAPRATGKWIYVLGGLLSLLIWTTAEGLWRALRRRGHQPGLGLVYVLVFLTLILIDRAYGPSPYSVDYFLERRWPWSRVAEWTPQPLADWGPAFAPVAEAGGRHHRADPRDRRAGGCGKRPERAAAHACQCGGGRLSAIAGRRRRRRSYARCHVA